MSRELSIAGHLSQISS